MELRTQVAEHWEKRVMGPREMEASPVSSLGRTGRAVPRELCLCTWAQLRGSFHGKMRLGVIGVSSGRSELDRNQAADFREKQVVSPSPSTIGNGPNQSQAAYLK